MTDDMEPSELEDIIGRAPLESDDQEQLYYREFKPWHHPRKQWVRAKQWSKFTEKLIKYLKKNNEERLSYLTLPGDDFLDIREIYKTCLNNSIELKYLGFNTATNTLREDPLLLNHHEMLGKVLVSQHSKIERERLELIAKQNSLAAKSFQSYGPFDVVNIDLCNSVAIHSNKPNDVSYFDMLLELMNCQFHKKHTPWLLFLSTTVSVPEINENVVESFIQIVKANIEVSKEFKVALESSLVGSCENLDELLSSCFANDSPDMVSVFGISFCKWLIKICLQAEPNWKLSVEDVCHYTVQNNQSTLVSFALKFEKSEQSIEDPTGLASISSTKVERVLEPILAVEALEKIVERTDVDNYLTLNSDKFENMKRASIELLKQSRYPVEDYEEWLLSQA